MTALTTMPDVDVQPTAIVTPHLHNNTVVLYGGMTQPIRNAGLEAGNSIRFVTQGNDLVVGVGVEERIDGRSSSDTRPIRDHSGKGALMVTIPRVAYEALGIPEDVDSETEFKPLVVYVGDGLLAFRPTTSETISVDDDLNLELAGGSQ